MSSSYFRFLVYLVVIANASCAFSPKFSGPKYDVKTNTLKVEPDKVVVLALTNAKLDRSKRKNFDSNSREIFERIEGYEGYLGGRVKIEILGDEVWTMTVWESTDALDKFVNSKRHQNAINSSHQAMKKFRHLNTMVPAKELPYTWDQAQSLLNAIEYHEHTP